MEAVEQMYCVEADRLAGTQVIVGSSVRQGPSDGRSVVESEAAPPEDTESENPLANSKVDIEEEMAHVPDEQTNIEEKMMSILDAFTRIEEK